MRHWEDLERLLATLYLKEIDQEENVWRSLPFFSATLAVEVLVLNQVLPLAAGMSGDWWWVLLGTGATLSCLILGVLLFLYRSIRRRSFSYVASGKDLVEYVRALESAASTSGATPGDGRGHGDGSVADRLRTTLIGQLAAATDANRAINQSRAAERTRAGILLLASIVTTSIVVGVTITHGMVADVSWEPGRGSAESDRHRPAAAEVPRTGRDGSDGQTGPSGATEDAGGKQGLELPRGPSIPTGGGGAK